MRYFQLQQYKLGGPPSNVPAIEDKPKENGQVDTGDQISNKVSCCLLNNNHTSGF